jgi:ribosomal-protein-alanine N-acetyltransferase
MTIAQQVGHEAPPRPLQQSNSIRLGTTRDWMAVCRIECACFGWGRVLTGLWPRAGSAGATTWIYEVAGRPAGYLIAYEHEIDHRPVMYVGGVGVLPQYRKGGLGTCLMQAVLVGYRSVWLHVRAGNAPAIAMYRKLGMVELRRMPRFYSNGETALVMGTTDLALASRGRSLDSSADPQPEPVTSLLDHAERIDTHQT